MENLAYLHSAFAYEDSESSQLVPFLFNKTAAPNWKRLSGQAWKYMLPLILMLSILGSVNSVFALQKGDQDASANNLKQQLTTADFHQTKITQIYAVPTENTDWQFQHAANVTVNDIIEIDTSQNLETGRKPPASNSVTTATATTTKIPIIYSVTHKRQNPHLLTKGDEGEDVIILQERLRMAGFYYGNATGIFGPITEEGVKRFQQAYKLKVDGVVGAATLAKLTPIDTASAEATSKKAVNRDQLSLGDRGEAVRILQEHLIKAGYLQGPPNGYYGSYTADAISRFQKAHRLDMNSIADTTTRMKLHSLAKTSPKSDFSILEIQMRLQEKGFYKGQLNGMMADDTKKAIKRAQEFYGISFRDIKSGGF
ncbi:peptidoglycan-binding protein [Anabaena cylindrica UHCC 0172]|uniref:peptidoglycan-binding domain-containing protein n=1 Tax=Anabaena cylindrica TaxID=1165 RepID=UPI002B207D5D|nr:peptidoglycan-binding protein [Anabaena cylindrica]MEA5551569.1 peptidoglycan-binding protein [Anabaena cylindrica UHCC 0172]